VEAPPNPLNRTTTVGAALQHILEEFDGDECPKWSVLVHRDFLCYSLRYNVRNL
jgi:hypothetical protein